MFSICVVLFFVRVNVRTLLVFQASAAGGLGSVKAEVLADTAAALASANVKVVSRKIIAEKLHTVRLLV